MRIEPGSDRRVHEVSLTGAGAGLLARAFPHWESAQAQVTRALGAERFDRLLSDLRLAVETPKVE
jgi:DNA-binding MarR family transcriptional regulator